MFKFAMNHSLHLKLVLGVAAVLLVLGAFGVPVLSNLPLLGLLLICPLMIMFMMRGMNHGDSQEDEDQADKTDAATRSGHRH